MYNKNITPAFETIGKRRKLTGYLAELHDEQILIHSQEYSTCSQAEQALDRIVYELLTDLAEQGLVDDVAGALVAEGVTCTQIPSWLADAQAKTAACSEAHPCDNVNHDHTGYRTITTDSPDYRLHVNRVIVRTQAALGVPCKLCGGDHHIQSCPSIRARLFAESVVMVMDLDCDLGGPGGADLYADAFDLDSPDLIVEAGILVNKLEEMVFDLEADYQAEGRFPPHAMRGHTRLCRILAKAERRLQRREFAVLDDDYADALAEGAMGSYNGVTV